MKQIEAYRCEITGSIFDAEKDARQCEFRAMMKQVGGSLPAMGSVSSVNIMEWLARSIESEVYPNVIDRLSEALNYFQKNVRERAF